MVDRVDVVIVGGGPVGMGLAIELGQRGVRTIVVERHEALHRVPKGQNLTQRSGEHFRFWGVSWEIRAASVIPHDYGSAGMTAYGSLLSGYHYDWYRRAQVREFYAADHERLPQYATEAVLRGRVAGLAGVEVLYGWSGVGVAQDDAGVRVAIESASGEKRSLAAAYCVGCDGNRSVVREAAGIEQDVDPHDRLMVLAVFRSVELHGLLQNFAGKSYFNVLTPELDGYWQFLGRVDLAGGWFFHAPVPAGTTRGNFDFTALLHRVVGAEFAVEFEHIGFWDLRIATAKSYQAGRVFIAGDAAHSHPPYGGFGINTGFEDARNLGWKLAMTLEGWGGDGLLASYSAERQPVFASTAQDFIGRMIRDDRDFVRGFDPVRDREAFEAEWARRASGGNADVTGFAPNYEGSPVIWGPEGGISSARGRHAFAARAGHHLAPLPLSSGGDVFDALGPGFTLLAFGADGGEFEKAAAKTGVPLHVVRDDNTGGREAYGAKLILVRPDHFIAWAGDTADAGAVLARAAGQT